MIDQEAVSDRDARGETSVGPSQILIALSTVYVVGETSQGMDHLRLVELVLLAVAVFGVATTYLFVATAIEYRHRDNGLAYILFVLGVGVWNGTFAAQLVATDPTVEQFFLSLSLVGALLAGLGWFLFAATASSTPALPASRPVFGAAAVLVGLGIALAMTTPIHDLYWQFDPTGGSAVGASDLAVGYWLHTALIAGLFGAGAGLFAAAWRDGVGGRYPRWYAVLGVLAVPAVVVSNALFAGALTVAPFGALALGTVGWLQAKRWTGFPGFREVLTPIR